MERHKAGQDFDGKYSAFFHFLELNKIHVSDNSRDQRGNPRGKRTNLNDFHRRPKKGNNQKNNNQI